MKDCFGYKRKFIMGVSSILIVLFHTDFLLPSVLTYIRRLGYLQVDVFMLISGYGVWHSYQNTGNIGEYYKKRLIRVLPTYWVLAVPFFLFKLPATDVSICDVVGVFTATSLWIPDRSVFSWYAQLIVFCYFISPIFIELVKNTNKKSVLLFSILFSVPFALYPRLMMAVSRIAPFVLGMILASIGNQREELLSKRTVVFSFAAGIALLAVLRLFLVDYLYNITGNEYSLVFYPGILLAPGFIAIISKVNDVLGKRKFGNFVASRISMIGEFSFEVYIFQSLLYMICRRYFNISYNNFSFLLLACFAIVGGVMFGKFVSYPIQNMLLRKDKHEK